MKKQMVTLMTLLAAALEFTACAPLNDDPGPAVDRNPLQSQFNWTAAADSSTAALVDRFWFRYSSDTKGYFIDNPIALGNTAWSYNYWPQAHAIDVITDAYIRTAAPANAIYGDMFPIWYDGVREKNGNTFNNVYTDDMEWIGIALMRIYNALGGSTSQYLDAARSMWPVIMSRWGVDGCGGGLRWCTTATPSANACSNGPGAVMALLLYNATQDESYLNDAKKIYAWEKSTLLNQATGAIADNMQQGGTISGGPLTYNQGTMMGAGYMLFKITGEKHYLDEASLMADYTLNNLTDGSKTYLRDEGSGDNSLFKGIFIRYFVDMIHCADVPAAKRTKWYNFLSDNAVTAWTRGIDKTDADGMYFSQSWDKPAYVVSAKLNAQICGCTLIEAIAAAQKP
ncbi:MAG: glycoside hydrolase family 76 protein [Rikenellaceae bacterium]|jgi:predicted alpha-1,6-mannanase (GH76 family)|nr:glycoside hydrolase family 76 protein [Rikenellaceae bacterium]